MAWIRRRFRVPVELDDAFAGALWLSGSQGHEVMPAAAGVQVVVAFFAGSDPEFNVPPDLAARGVEWLGADVVEECDWQEAFRRAAPPFRVGRRLVIDPGEDEGRFFLRLPARRAFGTGTHESTRLALELMEDLDWRDRTVLDVGTGTGVLALAARLFGARHAVGFDVDLAAAFAARENARRNAVTGCSVFAGSLAALATHRPFDIGLINVVPDEARPTLAELAACLRPGAQLVVSGLLSEEARGWGEELRAAGFAPAGEARQGEWIGLLLERV